MKECKPFAPLGDTYLIPADSTAPAGVQVPATDSQAPQAVGTYRIMNAGTEVVHLGVSSKSAAAATANAVAATAGTPAAGKPVAPGAVEILKFSEAAYFSGVTASVACNVYITPGEGM